MWQHWVHVVLGLWIIAIPFIDMAAATMFWALVVTGAAVALLAVWGVQETHSERSAGHMRYERG